MISAEDQLRSAADRLGVEIGELQTEFRFRIISATLGGNFSSQISTNHATSVQSDAICKALHQSQLSICERAFGTSPSQGTPFSPEYFLNSAQRTDENSAASASSSAAAAQLHSNSKHKYECLTGPCENTVTSEDDSVPSMLRGAKVTREISKVELSQSRNLDGSGKESAQQEGSPFPFLSETASPSPPTCPIDCILSFARGKQVSLIDVSDLDEENALRKMRTLSIIPGCDKYTGLCLFNYVGALFKIHLNLVQSYSKDLSGSMEGIDEMRCEMSDSSWRTFFADNVEEIPVNDVHTESCAPIIRKTVDLFQFTYRLVDKISCADDPLTKGFLEGLYSSDTPKLVASLTSTLLSKWAEAWRQISSFPRQSLLLEWCIRLLTGFIVYELSPVSQFRHMRDISSDAFVVFNLSKEGVPSLSLVVDYCFQFVSSHQIGKECRIALCELVQAYVIWSTNRSPEGGAQARLWRETQRERQEYLNSLVGKEAFWTIAVQSALQQVKKLPQLSDSFFEYTFLSSLVSLSAAKRALFDDKQDKSKRMLLNLMIRNLELMNRDLLSYFVEAERIRTLFPGIHTFIDFAHGLIASAAVQREILSAEPATKGHFLSSLETLIANAAKITRSNLEVEDAMECARKGPFAKMPSAELDSCEAKAGVVNSQTGTKKENERMNAVNEVLARGKAVAFAAKLVGYLGKSVEDGSWDMSQMNSIKALFQARINSSRTRHRLWNDIYKIQRGVEKKVGSQVLLSTPERTSFAMVVEVVRKHVVCDLMDRNLGLPTHEGSDESQATVTVRVTDDVKACFPPFWNVPELQHSVCRAQGYTDFEDNHDLLVFMRDKLTEKGQQILARYDPESPYTVKWVRLQKRNAYIGRARDLLDKADRTVGQRCSCVPGYPKENGNSNESRVACSNDLCENRHMKIECVPGKCGSGSYCMNQRMQNLDYAKFKMVSFPGKGVGIVADEDIPEGALVGEYQGEVVTMEEYERRVQEYEGERHFYFMTLTNKLVIDASRKSQATRFLNHSCNPNSETQKWNADGEPRVGIFAKRAISKGEEITFDYGARSLTQYSAQCLCGAKKCRGLLAMRKEEIGTMKGLMQESSGKGDNRSKNKRDIDSKSPKQRQKQLLEEDRRDSVVKERIKTAKRYLQEADIISKKADQNPPFQRDREVGEDFQQKLKLWKVSMRRAAGISDVPEKGLETSPEESRFPRIPRRSALRPKDDKNALEKGRDESTERNNLITRKSASRDAAFVAVAQNVRSSMASRMGTSASRWALFEETLAGKHGGSQTPLKRHAEGDSVRRSSKVPRTGFLPTTSKLKRQPLRPRIAKRRSTRDQDGNDSMGEYSTASEAEPIIEEPITSPSRLPDGNGACSDDEFTAAPPVESIRFSPTGRRWNHSDYDYDRRGHDRRQMGRGEFDCEGEQSHDRQKFRSGPSSRLTLNKSNPNLHQHAHSRHRVHSPRTNERFRSSRADPRDVLGQGTNPSGPGANRRRDAGYRTERSPSEHRYRQAHSGKPGNKRGVHDSEEINDGDHHRRPRILSSDHAFVHKIYDSAHVSSRLRYSEPVENPRVHHQAARRSDGDVSPLLYREDDQDWSRVVPEDTGKSMSAELRSTEKKVLSCAHVDADRRTKRRKMGVRRSLLDENPVILARPYHEKPEQARSSRAIRPRSVDSLDRRPRGDHKVPYHAKKGTRWASSQRAEDRGTVDLRNLLTGQSRKTER